MGELETSLLFQTIPQPIHSLLLFLAKYFHMENPQVKVKVDPVHMTKNSDKVRTKEADHIWDMSLNAISFRILKIQSTIQTHGTVTIQAQTNRILLFYQYQV